MYRDTHSILCKQRLMLAAISPQLGHGVYMTPIDFCLIKKRFPSSQWNKIL